MNFYDGVEMHRTMVGDTVRTESFRKSIAATVRPGDVVLDVGTGSGILSLFAAQAGAARVYAVERARGAATLARRIIADNGYFDRVHVLESNAESVILPEGVDVLMSEWLGVFGIDENMLPPVLIARDRFLKPGGILIPSVVSAWLAPVFNEEGAEASMFHATKYGLDLSALAPYSPDQPVWLPSGTERAELSGPAQCLWEIDTARFPVSRARSPFAAELTFSLTGPVNGLVAWFSAQMPGTADLTNSSGAPGTHWGQFLFPVVNASEAQPGDVLRVGFHCLPTVGAGTEQLWSTQLDEGAPSVHDTRRVHRPLGAPPWRIGAGERRRHTPSDSLVVTAW